MRFKQFLSEEFVDFDADKFEKDCDYYLNLMEGTNQFMYHGTSRPIVNGAIANFIPRTGPTDSPIMLHDAANEYFNEQFGKPFRNGLFVTGQQFVAANFAGGDHKVAIIVPIGEFEWLSCDEITDMTGTFQKYAGVGHASTFTIPEKKAGVASVMQEIETAKWSHNKNLPNCLRGISEVMLWCPNNFYTFIAEKSKLPQILFL